MTNPSTQPAINSRHLVPLIAVSLLWTGIANAAQEADTAMPSATDQTLQMERKSQHSQSAKDAISDWPKTSKKVANKMLEKYGEPDGVTSVMLVWSENQPWKRTIVHKEEIQHDFPVPHVDVLEQFINYDVPVEKFSDLAKYDGSVVAYRTNGELSARCDKEGANILALNLANDVIEGDRSVDEARAFYAQTIEKVMAGETPEYVQSLQFPEQSASAADPDEPFDKGASSP